MGFLIFLMTGNKGFFKSESDIYTYMDDSAAIVEGAPVRLNLAQAFMAASVDSTTALHHPRDPRRLTFSLFEGSSLRNSMEIKKARS